MRHADAACGCVKRHAFCLIPYVWNAVRFICLFRRRLAFNWHQRGRGRGRGRGRRRGGGRGGEGERHSPCDKIKSTCDVVRLVVP